MEMGPFNPGMPGGQMQKININPNELAEFKCPNCGNEFFAQAQKIKMLPRLISPAGEAGAMFLDVGKICTQCGWMADIGTIAQMVKDILEGDDNESKLEVMSGGKVEG